MSKILRLLTVSLLLTSIMIASFAGAVFAGEEGKEYGDPDRLRDYSCCEDPCDGPDRDRLGQD